MGFTDLFRRNKSSSPPTGSYADLDPRARAFLGELENRLRKGEGPSDSIGFLKGILAKQASSNAPVVGIPDLGFKGARQQLFQRFNLIDLYGLAHNNSTMKTATLALKQEVFRRGMQWEPAFTFRCVTCDTDYSKDDLRSDEDRVCPQCNSKLKEPNPAQRVRFEKLMPKVNIYNQSFVRLMQSLEDDLNIADDAFLFLSSEYKIDQKNGRYVMSRQIKQLFRLDPVFVEFDTDDQNRPGFAHHICLAHRNDLLEIPKDAGWEYDWKGTCPIDGYPTFPVMYRYLPSKGTYGSQKGGVESQQDALYLVKGEVLHVSKFSPSELYGYSPVLSIYEKALSLIGMDRYLYEYFFERQIPQGVITTVTDDPEGLEVRKEQMLAETLNNPHYIPWLAVSSQSGQGRTEFVRFAYSLDEIQFLPVQEALERAISGVYGVPGLFMGYDQSYGGLNNESQQVTRMSRGAQLSQDVYNTEVFPQLLAAFGVTDWRLRLSSAEERSELTEWELKQRKAQWAQTMVSMGFGASYNQDEDEFTISGEVKSQAEQQESMMGGFGGFGGGDVGAGGF